MNKYQDFSTYSVWAYELFGRWAILNEDGVLLDSYDGDDFYSIIDFWITLGYDVIITTDESWKELANAQD